MYVFYQLCSHSTSRQYMRDETEATPYLLDLLHDRNPEVQRVCDATLQMIGDKLYTNNDTIQQGYGFYFCPILKYLWDKCVN